MYTNVRLRLFKKLKFPAAILCSLLVTSVFVVATSELFREGVWKMEVVFPGTGDTFRQCSQEPWQSTWEVQPRFLFLLLVNIQTELQLAFIMEVVLLWMRAEAVQEHLILRRYFFGQFCSQLCLLKQSGEMVDYLKAWQSVVAVEKKMTKTLLDLCTAFQ